MKAQVIVLGGGCGGLWLVYELEKRGYCSILIDNKEVGAYASTRNQSWLHSGALYAMSGHDAVAKECIRGYKAVSDFARAQASSSIDEESGCMFLFQSGTEAHMAGDRLKALGINGKIVTLNELQQAEPILNNTHPQRLSRSALKTNDVPFDSFRILQGLQRAAFARNRVVYREVSGNLTGLQISQDGEVWRVSNGSFIDEATILISAAGALNTKLPDDRVGASAGFIVQESLVAVFHQRLCNNVLSFRRSDSGYLTAVPFDGGTTFNLGGHDAVVTDPRDRKAAPDDFKEAFAALGRQITDFLPGIVNVPECGVHFYSCQKLNNTNASGNPFPLDSHGPRHFFWVQSSPNFFHYYPGKFTTAPIAAKEFVEVLVAALGSPQSATFGASSIPPQIARRPYLSGATHFTRVSGGVLTFAELDG
jgi:glycine/D-amino acid oxidase-like deaminating enzyme